MIKVDKLVKNYNGHNALNGISFEINERDVFGFIGPNGAGKTTTINIIATILEPTSGTVLVDGNCVVNYPDKVRPILGYMPDYYGVYSRLTVLDYLEFFSAAYAIPWRDRGRIIKDIMELTELTKLSGKELTALSKGMKQRVCLARALINNPKVLLLDEPAAGLDPRARIELRMLIKELQRMGKTILVSSHILTELADMCNRVGIVEQGNLVACGSVKEIEGLLGRKEGVLISFRRGGELIADIISKVDGIRDWENGDSEVKVYYDGGEEKVMELVSRLVTGGVGVTGVRQMELGLEDIFMKITTGEVQ